MADTTRSGPCSGSRHSSGDIMLPDISQMLDSPPRSCVAAYCEQRCCMAHQKVG